MGGSNAGPFPTEHSPNKKTLAWETAKNTTAAVVDVVDTKRLSVRFSVASTQRFGPAIEALLPELRLLTADKRPTNDAV